MDSVFLGESLRLCAESNDLEKFKISMWLMFVDLKLIQRYG